MAEENEAPEGEAEENNVSEDGGKKSKKKLIMFVAIGLVVVLGAGGGAFFFMSGGGDQEMAAKTPAEGEQDGEAPAEEEAAEAGEEASEEGGDETAEASEGGEAAEGDTGIQLGSRKKKINVSFGETYQMKTFHLNLGNPLENHYIRVDVALEYRGGEEQRAEIERRLPQLRDAIVGVISRQTRDMILDPDGKAQLRREMLIRVNRYMQKAVEAVYITDILIE